MMPAAVDQTRSLRKAAGGGLAAHWRPRSRAAAEAGRAQLRGALLARGVVKLLVLAVLPLGATPSVAWQASLSERPAGHIKVVRRGVIIGDRLVRLPSDVSDLVDIIGAPSRTDDLANRILTWDELGIYAFVYLDDHRVFAIAFRLGASDLPFWPTKDYDGQITVRGAEVPRVLDKQRLHEAGFDFDAGWWVRRLGRVQISLQVNEDQNGLCEIQIEG